MIKGLFRVCSWAFLQYSRHWQQSARAVSGRVICFQTHTPQPPFFSLAIFFLHHSGVLMLYPQSSLPLKHAFLGTKLLQQWTEAISKSTASYQRITSLRINLETDGKQTNPHIHKIKILSCRKAGFGRQALILRLTGQILCWLWDREDVPLSYIKQLHLTAAGKIKLPAIFWTNVDSKVWQEHSTTKWEHTTWQQQQMRTHKLQLETRAPLQKKLSFKEESSVIDLL